MILYDFTFPEVMNRGLGTEANNTNLDHIDFLPFHSNWAQKLHLWNSTPWIFRRKDGFGHRRRIHEKMSLALRLKESKNQDKVCLCPNDGTEAKIDGEQIKKNTACTQTPQKKRKSTGNKSRKSLPVPKRRKRSEKRRGTNQEKHCLCPNAVKKLNTTKKQ